MFIPTRNIKNKKQRMIATCLPSDCFYVHKWVSDCWSTPNEQFFSHIRARTS
jgi:hypothetical protein